MGVIRDFFTTASESVTRVVEDGLEAIISEKVCALMDWACKMFFEGFGPNIGSFLSYFDSDATYENSIGSVNGWVGFSFEDTTSSIVKIFAVFALMGLVLAILLYVTGIVKTTLMPYYPTKDTPAKLTIRFAVAVLIINFSVPIMQGMFAISEQIWDVAITQDVSASSTSSKMAEMADAFSSGAEDAEVEADTGDGIKKVGMIVAGGAVTYLTGGEALMGGLIIFAIVALILIYEMFKFMMEVVERYLVAAFMYMMFPTIVPVIITEETLDVFKKFLKMLACQLFLIIMNLLFIRMFVVMLTNIKIAPMSFFILLAFLKAAQRLDSYMHMMGLNNAVTGGELLDSAAGSWRNLQNLGKTLSHGAGMATGASGAKTAPNGVQIKAGDNMLDTMKHGKAGIIPGMGSSVSASEAAVAQSKVNGKADIASDNPNKADIFKDGSIAADMRAGDMESYNAFKGSPDIKEGLTAQMFDPEKGPTWENNALTKAIGADSLENTRMSKDGFKLEPGAQAVFKDKNGNVTGRVGITGSFDPVKNEIAQVETDRGTFHIGALGEQKLSNVSQDDYDTDLSSLKARTGWSKEDIQMAAGGDIDFDRVKYNEAAGALELYNGKGSGPVGAVIENNSTGNQEVIAFPESADISQMDARLQPSNRQSNVNADGLYQTDDGYTFDTADERNSHEYQASTSNSYGALEYDDYSTGDRIAGRYEQAASNAESARALQDDIASGVYGDPFDGNQIESVTDLSSLHRNTEDNRRYRNGTNEIRFDNGDIRQVQVIKNSSDLVAVKSRNATLVKGSNGRMLAVMNKGKESIPKRRDSHDKHK